MRLTGEHSDAGRDHSRIRDSLGTPQLSLRVPFVFVWGCNRQSRRGMGDGVVSGTPVEAEGKNDVRRWVDALKLDRED